MEARKKMNPEIENNTFTKRIGQTTYVVRFHYSENARVYIPQPQIRVSAKIDQVFRLN